MVVRIYTKNINKNKIEKSIFPVYEINIQIYSRKEYFQTCCKIPVS